MYRVDGLKDGCSSNEEVCCICMFVTIIYSGISEVPILLIGFAIVCLYLEEMVTKTIEM